MGITEKVYANDLIEREVLDLSAGTVLGSIVDYIITGDGTVSLIGILGERWFGGGSGIPPATITNINPHRVTIGDSSEVTEFEPNGENSFSVNTDTFIWGKNVVADTGELLGGLEDFSFRLADGAITDLVVIDSAEKRQRVAVDKILTIGRDYIVVIRGANNGEEIAAERPAAPAYTAASTTALSGGEPAEPAGEPAAESPTRAALSQYDQRKYDYLLGKRAHRAISDSSGELIAAAGVVLDDTALKLLVEAGLLSRVFIEHTSDSSAG